MKRALLVGIDDYPGTGSDLSSCVNDIAHWSSILMERFGFERENIRLLANDRAKKGEVMKRLKWLTSGAKDGDTLVFLYSGHGTTFTERYDDGHLDEAKDEALCLYGYRADDMLIDDELTQIFSNISPEVNLTVICDSCFSGGMDKAFAMEVEGSCGHRRVMPKFKYLPPPVDISHRSDPLSPVRVFGCGLKKEKGKEASEKHDLSSSKSLLLSACREIETAAADRPETQGLSVFSFYAIRALRTSDTDITAKQLINRVAQNIASAGYPQIPQFKGKKDLFDKPVFCEGKSESKKKRQAKTRSRKSQRR